MEAHPYADRFPLLPQGELEELAASIRENGLRQPIVVTPDGLILDGRNRAAACALVGIEPETVTYEGDDLAEYVIDSNVTRRNMSTGARAMATALVMVDAGQRKNGKWSYGAFADSDKNQNRTFQTYVTRAGTVLDWRPELAPQVIDESVRLDQAYAMAKEARDKVDAEKRAAAIEAARKREATIKEQQDNDRKLAALTKDQSKFLTQIEDGSMTIAVAYAAHMEATRKQREAQRQIEMGWRDTTTRIAECVRYLEGGEPQGEAFLKGFYPHESTYLADGMRLTRARIQSAIEFLETIKKGVIR